MTRTIKERFETKYWIDTQTDCWIWDGCSLPSGYGMLGMKDTDGKWRPKYAHRISYELFNADIPDGLSVCHRCDNPRCVNPDHLFLGTTEDNAQDMVKKGRSTKGTRNPQAKLDYSSVSSIRQDNRTQQQIADSWGVTRGLVGQIKRGVIWKD